MTARHTTAPRDRGSISLEVVILAPTLIALLGLMIAFGRIEDADGAVDGAAHAAARAASLERDAGSAQDVAQAAATHSLADGGITCQSTSASVDTGGFATQVGQAATVTVHVSCTARLSDIGLPGLPGSKTLASDWTSSIDTYRGRGQ